MLRTTLEAQYAIRELPFVRVDNAAPGRPLEFWKIEPTGDRYTDIEMGEHCAGMALDVAHQFEMPILIAMILRDIALGGRFTAVEAGFIAGVASAASAAHVGSSN